MKRVFLLLLVASVLPTAWGLDIAKVRTALINRFGTPGMQAFSAWERLLLENRDKPVKEQIRRVNEFFNRRIQSGDDNQIWGQSDYWATPVETLGKSAGDCEDFTIAKYFTLLSLGIANEQLRLIYVKARLGGSESSVSQAHMVLAYYPEAEGEPLILDNLISEIRPAGRRPDLTPVFSFNNKEIWQGAGNTAGPSGSGNLSRWQDLLKRAREEGFDP